LEDYAQKNGFTNIRHFTDDGVRGTTFKRPGLDAMLEEIRAGNVATVIIKDQSRIGRDVVEVGLLKRVFDEYHVRFIAANDNLDTANGFDIMSIFRDVINEWYVADTSRKIKTVFKSRMEKGLRCSGSVCYGYLASKENKGEWIVDEEAAAVVRRIFQSVLAGESIADIARALRAEKVPIPSEHWKRIGAPVRAAKYADPYAWTATTIGYILKRPEYTGRKVLGKTVCENYKTKRNRRTAPEEQYIFDGEIPAIVDEETWNTVQRLRETKRRAPKRQKAPNRLTGLLYCADCGAKLTHRHNLVQGRWIDDCFVCSHYRQLTSDCTMHYIPTAKMEAAILAAIQRVSWYVQNNEAEFIQRVREATGQNQKNAMKECGQKVNQAQRRCKELDGLVKKLYEGNATGKIPDKHFTRLLAEYDAEQTKLEVSIAEWQGQMESWKADTLKTDRFIELVRRYTDFSELTTPMLNEFVEKVVVHEGEGRGNSRRQRIDIYLNFIGAFEVPAHIVTPMEAEEQRRQQAEQAAKEARSQGLAKAREEKRKAEKREFTARKKAGLLTPEEQAADEARLAHNRALQKEWREKRKAAEPPKPPKPKSIKELIALQRAGAALAPEEAERFAAYRERKNRQHKEWYERQKAAQPPKPCMTVSLPQDGSAKHKKTQDGQGERIA
jgi:site-specific DNA recombinase